MNDDEEVKRLQKRLERERKARHDAESIAEKVTRDLYLTAVEREQMNVVLENANQSLREFVAVASHDLRAPITAILGYSSTLYKRWDRFPEEQKLEFLAVIGREGQRLSRLVDDLLVISRIESGEVMAKIEEVSLARTFENITQEFGERALGVEIVLDGDLRVLADPDHVQRILTNYLGNALKYGDPPIKAEADDAGEWVELRVSDSGEGIPEEFLPRLFGKFARADTVHKKEGSGLGLSIVRGLARANGGDAWYEPHFPTGATFGVRLPNAEANGKAKAETKAGV